jgi:hypothetical protein
MSNPLDSDGYPTEETLNAISSWSLVGDDPIDNSCKSLFEFIESIWKYASNGYFDYNEDGVYWLSTAGWSGNESIISALEENFIVQGLCWKASKAGGHYIYTLPGSRYKIDVELKVTEREEMEESAQD